MKKDNANRNNSMLNSSTVIAVNKMPDFDMMSYQ